MLSPHISQSIKERGKETTATLKHTQLETAQRSFPSADVHRMSRMSHFHMPTEQCWASNTCRTRAGPGRSRVLRMILHARAGREGMPSSTALVSVMLSRKTLACRAGRRNASQQVRTSERNDGVAEEDGARLAATLQRRAAQAPGELAAEAGRAPLGGRQPRRQVGREAAAVLAAQRLVLGVLLMLGGGGAG